MLTIDCFDCFRKLRKPRVTRIHMNLFASMILQCLVRLVIYADQWIVRQQSHNKPVSQALQQAREVNITLSTNKDEVWGIDNTVSIPKMQKFFPWDKESFGIDIIRKVD